MLRNVAWQNTVVQLKRSTQMVFRFFCDLTSQHEESTDRPVQVISIAVSNRQSVHAHGSKHRGVWTGYPLDYAVSS